jgi:hypothetical protein
VKPSRVQLSRRKGWRLPAKTVCVARPSKWGNPYKVGEPGIPDAWAAVNCFRNHAATLPVHELRGKNLACWCALNAPCHADVLLKLANT